MIRSKRPIRSGVFYTIKVDRKLRDGRMKLSSEDGELFGKSPGNTRGLNIRTPIYLGGINRPKVRLSASRVGVSDSFEGCITDVKIGKGGGRVNLISSAIESSDIVDCSVDTCPCLNEGDCVSSNPPICSCKNGFQ